QFGGLMRIVFGEIRITLDENCHGCEITGNHEVWRACGAVVFRYRRTPIAVVFSQVAVCMLARIHAYAFQLPFSQLERCIVPTMQKSAVPASTMLGVVDKKIHMYAGLVNHLDDGQALVQIALIFFVAQYL